jgi:hypothetical protein
VLVTAKTNVPSARASRSTMACQFASEIVIGV